MAKENAGLNRRSSRRPRPTNRGEEINRRLISAEAAKIMAEESVQDFQSAKRKAANRLGLPETKNLPTNQEIETELKQYLSLFHGDKLATTLRHLRETAIDAMRFLAEFQPRLVGPVLSGTVTPSSEIQLHLTAETAEEVGFALASANIPYDLADRRIRFGGDRTEMYPAYRFVADGVTIELCIFSHSSVREAPFSPVDGKPMRRASLKEVESLLSDV